MMNRIDSNKTGLASLGRDEDKYMAHVASGEMVVPPVITPETRQRLQQEMKAAGLSPDNYTVGEGMSINPITGLPEFGWLKKTFKSIKKVAKVLAPLAMFIPGVGTAIGGVLGGLGGGITSALGAISPGLASTLGGLGSSAMSGIAGLGIPGLSSIAGGTAGGFAGIPSALTNPLAGGTSNLVSTPADAMMDYQNALKINPSLASNIMATLQGTMTPGQGGLGGIFSGGGADNKGNYGVVGDLLGGFTDKLGLTKHGLGTKTGGGIMSNFPGGGMGMAAMGLLGKAVYDDYKRREGGLADTPQVSMDSLGRYQLAKALGTGGTREEFGLSPAPASLDFDAMNQPVARAGGGLISRQYFNKGGIAEKDMREGGESEGPGTGTSDDVPAMLSDGEFVMTAAATKGAGAYDLNKTKSGIELIKTTDSDRERGVTNMRELMNIFEAV